MTDRKWMAIEQLGVLPGEFVPCKFARQDQKGWERQGIVGVVV
jgi:hypothetical protein